MRTRVSRSARRGFTLAELMVVVVILGLLATLVVKNVIPALFKAKVQIAKTEIMNIGQAIEQYMINNGSLPESLEPLVTPDQNGVTYLKDMTATPNDPWGFPYVYEKDPNGRTFEVKSYGKDGEPGGEEDNADISNKTIANERTGERAR
ncbi:MAG TPA: type II secretion system major pseudopilin GspG [Planctomycetota bacterium]|jgi:general secretion pathway protein G|nr:type II secretion system major pseudopilin GspG [Planctomycetota bacterium]